MRTRSVVAVVVLAGMAGCNDPRSVYVEVHADGLVLDKIEVFVGVNRCVDSAGAACAITPMNQSERLHVGPDGGAWYRNDDELFGAMASGGTATFKLKAAAEDQTVQVVAVGLGGSGPVAMGVIRDLDVPASGGYIARLDLTAAAAIPPNEPDAPTDHPDGDFVFVWNQSAAPSDCVLAEHWAGGVGSRTLVVPEADADCDGVPTLDPADPTSPNPLECDPMWYAATEAPSSFREADCATPSTVASHPACVLAGPPCVDGLGVIPGSSCHRLPQNVCVPAGVCTSDCANQPTSGPGTSLSGCVNTQATTQPIAQVHCYIAEADLTGGPCTTTLGLPFPNAGHAVLDFLVGGTGGVYPPTGHFCTGVAFSPTDSLANLTFQSNVFAPAAPDTAVLTASNLSVTPNTCNFDLTWTSGAFTRGTEQHGLIKVSLDNGNYELLPLLITSITCTNATKAIDCYVQMPPSGETLVNCAR